MWKVIWIDLWTTNSCVSYMLWDKSEVIANSEWARTTPSIVYIKWDEMLVGDLAKRKAILEPKNVIFETKRFIGRKFKEVENEVKDAPFDMKEWKDGWVVICIPYRIICWKIIMFFISNFFEFSSDESLCLEDYIFWFQNCFSFC